MLQRGFAPLCSLCLSLCGFFAVTWCVCVRGRASASITVHTHTFGRPGLTHATAALLPQLRYASAVLHSGCGMNHHMNHTGTLQTAVRKYPAPVSATSNIFKNMHLRAYHTEVPEYCVPAGCQGGISFLYMAFIHWTGAS